MSKLQYTILLRFLATVFGILFAFISVIFSVDGFNFQVDDSAWMGVVLGLGIIVIELVWNQSGMNHKNWALLVGGILAYFYGITTNVIGIATQQGVLTDEPMRYVLPVIMGLFLEIIPEPLILWGVLYDGKGNVSNTIGSLLNNVTSPKKNAQGGKRQTIPTIKFPQQQQQRNNNIGGPLSRGNNAYPFVQNRASENLITRTNPVPQERAPKVDLTQFREFDNEHKPR